MEKKSRKQPGPIPAQFPVELLRGKALLVQLQCHVLELPLLPLKVSSRALYSTVWTYKLG